MRSAPRPGATGGRDRRPDQGAARVEGEAVPVGRGVDAGRLPRRLAGRHGLELRRARVTQLGESLARGRFIFDSRRTPEGGVQCGLGALEVLARPAVTSLRR